MTEPQMSSQQPYLGWNHWKEIHCLNGRHMTKDAFWRLWTQHWSSFPYSLFSCRHLQGLYSLLAGQSTLFMESSGKQKQETPCSKLLRISRWHQLNTEARRRTFLSTGPCTQLRVQAHSHEAGFDSWPCLFPPGHLNKL